MLIMHGKLWIKILNVYTAIEIWEDVTINSKIVCKSNKIQTV